MPIRKRRPWPKEDVEIPLRALLFDITQSSFYEDGERCVPNCLISSRRAWASSLPGSPSTRILGRGSG